MKNKLKLYRWEAGLKQYQLANMLGCSAPYLSMVENDREAASTEFKQRVSSALEVPVDKLFPREAERM